MPMVTVFEKETLGAGKTYPQFAEVPKDVFTPSRLRQLREQRIIGDYDREDLPDKLPKGKRVKKEKYSQTEVREQEATVAGAEANLAEHRALLTKMYLELGVVPPDEPAEESDGKDEASTEDESETVATDKPVLPAGLG